MNAAEKARLAKEAKNKENKIKKANSWKFFKDIDGNFNVVGLGLGLIVLGISIFFVSIVFNLINGLSSYDNEVLKVTQSSFWMGLAALVISPIVFVFISKYAYDTTCVYYNKNGQRISGAQAHYVGGNWLVEHGKFCKVVTIISTIVSGLSALATIVLLIMTLSKGTMRVEKYFVAEEDGIVYSLRTNGYKIEGLYNDPEHLVIRANSQYATITYIPKNLFKGNKTIKSVSFVDGDLEIRKNAFKDCINLESVSFDAYSYNVAKNVFKNCVSIKEVKVLGSTINVSSNVYDSDAYRVFSNTSNATLILDGAKFKNFYDVFGTIIAKNTSYLIRHYDVSTEFTEMPKDYITKTLVIEDGFNFNESEFKNYTRLYKFSFSDSYPEKDWKYFSQAQEIYLPSSITNIPEYFFGENPFTQKIKVYFAGTEEQWNQITIAETGNSNYINGNVVVEFNKLYQ